MPTILFRIFSNFCHPYLSIDLFSPLSQYFLTIIIKFTPTNIDCEDSYLWIFSHADST